MHTHLRPPGSLRHLRAASLALAAAASACSYEELTSAVNVTVDGVPPTATHARVELTDANNVVTPYNPVFGPGALPNQRLELALGPPSTAGAFRVRVVAIAPPAETEVGVGEATGTYAGSPVSLQVTLSSSGTAGSYGAPCIQSQTPGGANSCNQGLECRTYPTSGDRGICTFPCPTGTCPSGVTPAPTCQPFQGGANYCQWECTGGGACPIGTTCRVVGAQSFCHGS
jgi:hypothetical protein